MTKEELRQLSDRLPRKAKTEIAIALDCDPSKISRALRGIKTNPKWMSRLINEIMARLPEEQAA